MQGSSFNSTLESDPEIKELLEGFSKEISENLEDDKSPNEDTTHDQEKPRKPVADLKCLTFVRLIDPIHIPSYLIEQIKDRLYDVDKFYSYQKITCLLNGPNGPQLNPTNFLYAIINEKLKQVKGFAWLVVDLLTNTLVINNFSMDKEYWNKGESISILEEKCKKIMKDLSLSRIVWITKNYKFCEKMGFKKLKDAIMVYEE